MPAFPEPIVLYEVSAPVAVGERARGCRSAPTRSASSPPTEDFRTGTKAFLEKAPRAFRGR